MFLNLKKFFNLIKNLKFELIPKKSNILVITDDINYLLIKKILPKDTHFIGFPDKVNLLILIYSILGKKLSGHLSLNYLINYLKFSNPKLIINLYDNYIHFYELKKYFKDKKFIAIQNGYRGGPNDIFYSLKNLNKKYLADTIFCFNEIVGKEFKKYIKCETVNIGSFRNNFFKLKKVNNSNKVLILISSYVPHKKKDFFYKSKNFDILFNDFFLSDQLIFRSCQEYCLKKNIQLLILLKSNVNNDNDEKNFYEKNKIMKIKFLERKSIFSSYYYLNKYNYFVGSENTLTYEALARNRRVAVFAIRKKMLSRVKKKINNELNFYWPGKMNQIGNYWTHNINKKVFSKILDFVLNSTEKEWKKEIMKLDDNYKINFDQNNEILNSLIEKYLNDKN